MGEDGVVAGFQVIEQALFFGGEKFRAGALGFGFHQGPRGIQTGLALAFPVDG